MRLETIPSASLCFFLPVRVLEICPVVFATTNWGKSLFKFAIKSNSKYNFLPLDCIFSFEYQSKYSIHLQNDNANPKLF